MSVLIWHTAFNTLALSAPLDQSQSGVFSKATSLLLSLLWHELFLLTCGKSRHCPSGLKENDCKQSKI